MNFDVKQIIEVLSLSIVQINLCRFVEEKILSYQVKNDLLMVSEHLARDHKHFGVVVAT